MLEEKQRNFCGAQIRRLREAHNIALADLQALLKEQYNLEIDRTNLGRIENGIRAVSDVELAIFSRIFGLTADQLISPDVIHTNYLAKGQTLPLLPDHVSIKEAAAILNVSSKRVYAYVEDGRLPAVRAAHVIMIPLEALKEFKPKISGRPRKHTPPWRSSPTNTQQITTSILVPIRPGQEEQLRSQLQTLKETQKHLFPGAIARYLIERTEQHTLEILLLWRKNTKLSYSESLETFRATFANLLDWEHAQYSEGNVILHT